MAYRVGLLAAITRPSAERSRTRSPRLTSAMRTRLASNERPPALQPDDQPGRPAPAPRRRRWRRRSASGLRRRAGAGCGRQRVVLAGGVADAGAVVHACLDVRKVHMVAIRKIRANRKCLIRNGELPIADSVRADTSGVRADASRRRSPFTTPSTTSRSSPSMCGIVGAIADRDVVPVLIEGLKRLEYRGYDSAGIAVVDERRRAPRAPHRPGRRDGSRGARPRASTPRSASATRAGPPMAASPKPTRIRTSATASRWCTTASSRTTSSSASACVALGYEFESQTDTEVIAHLIHHYLKQGDDLLARAAARGQGTARRLRAGGGQPRASPTAWSARAWAARCWSAWARARTSSPPTSRRSCRRRAG